MAKCLYSNLGFSMWWVDDDYVLQDGEVFFDHYPATEEELLIAFPGRAAYIEEQRLLQLSTAHRKERDRQLVEVFDTGTAMVQSAIRLSLYPLAVLQAKQEELDLYAQALRGIPQQPGFPDEVTWPAIPTKELDLE